MTRRRMHWELLAGRLRSSRNLMFSLCLCAKELSCRCSLLRKVHSRLQKAHSRYVCIRARTARVRSIWTMDCRSLIEREIFSAWSLHAQRLRKDLLYTLGRIRGVMFRGGGFYKSRSTETLRPWEKLLLLTASRRSSLPLMRPVMQLYLHCLTKAKVKICRLNGPNRKIMHPCDHPLRRIPLG